MPFIDPNDVVINRYHEEFYDSAVLEDPTGDVKYVFDSDWTDEQIMMAVDFANDTYELGQRHGKLQLKRDIRNLLAM